MTEQALTRHPKILDFLLEGALYLEENPKKKWKGLAYKDLRKIFELLAESLSFDIDTKTASLKELAEAISQELAREEEKLESRIPPNLKQIVEEYEKTLEDKEQPVIFRERAAEKIKAFLLQQEKFAKLKALEEKIAAEALKKITQNPLTPEINREAVETITETIIKTLEPEENLEIQAKKIASLPESEKPVAEEKLKEDWQGFWEKTVEEKVVPQLEQKGLFLSEKQKDILKNLAPGTVEIPRLIQEFREPAPQREATKQWLTGQISPMEPAKAEKLVEIFTPVFINNLPEITITPEQIAKLPEEKKARLVFDLKTGARESFFISLAQVSPVLVDKGISLSSGEVLQIANSVLPENEEDILKIAAILFTPTEDRAQILEKDQPLQIETSSASKAPSADKTPLLFVSASKLAAFGKLAQIKDEKGQPVSKQIEQIVIRQGINQQTAMVLREPISHFQSLMLTLKGISPEDIEFTKESYLKRGLSPDSPQVKELEAIKLNLERFQQTSRLPTKLWQKWAEKSFTPFSIPNSNYGTLVEKQVTQEPAGVQKLFTRFFGQKEKTFFLSQSRAVAVKQYTVLRQKVFGGIKNWFSKTGVGQSVKFALEKAGQKSLQGIWNFSKTGVQKAITKGVTSLLAKIGIGAVTGGVGTLLALAGNKIIGGGLSLIKKGWSGIKSGFGISSAVLSGITGGWEPKEDQDMKWVILAVPLVFILIPVIIFLSTILKAQAFIKDVTSPFRKGEDYIALTKTANPDKFENTAPEPYQIKYTVSIHSKEKRLHKIKVGEKITLIDQGVSKTLDSKTTPRVNYTTPLPASVPDIEPGNTYSFDYEVQVSGKITDALLVNEVTVKGAVDGPAGVDLTKQTKIAATAVFGNPTSCFVFSGQWSNQEKTAELRAISQLSSKPNYTQALCQNPAQPIELIRLKNSDYCRVLIDNPPKIYLTNKCVGSEASTLYGLAHESGHVFVSRNGDVYNQFYSKFGGNIGPRLEDFICSYPLGKTSSEDFPETIAVYFTNLYYSTYTYHACGGKTINLQTDYPLHYNFIRPYIE